MPLPRLKQNDNNLYPGPEGAKREREFMDETNPNDIFTAVCVQLTDIDEEVGKLMDEGLLGLTVDGEAVPVITVDNERWAEFAKTWHIQNEDRNISPPLITVRRTGEEAGTRMGTKWTTPNRKHTTTFKLPTFENGVEGYRLFQVTQPTDIDALYEIRLIANYKEDTTQMAENFMREFSSRQLYIKVKGHYFRAILEETSQEDTMGEVDADRYYVRIFNIRVLGFVQRIEDFREIDVPNRIITLTEIQGETISHTSQSIVAATAKPLTAGHATTVPAANTFPNANSGRGGSSIVSVRVDETTNELIITTTGDIFKVSLAMIGGDTVNSLALINGKLLRLTTNKGTIQTDLSALIDAPVVITGATFNNVTRQLSIASSNGGSVSVVIPETDEVTVTGATLNSQTLAINSSDGKSVSVSLDPLVSTVKTDVSTLKSDVSVNKTDISTLKTNVATNTSDLSGLHTEVTGVKNDITAIESDIILLQTGVTATNTEVGDLQTQVGVIKNDIVGIKTNASGIQTEVDGLQTEVSGIQTDITAIQTAATATNTEVTGLKSEVSDIHNDITAINSDINNIESDVTDLQTDATNAKADIMLLQGEVSDVKTDVAAIQTDTAAIHADITTIQNDISNTQADFNDVSNRVAAIEVIIPAEATEDNTLADKAWVGANATKLTGATFNQITKELSIVSSDGNTVKVTIPAEEDTDTTITGFTFTQDGSKLLINSSDGSILEAVIPTVNGYSLSGTTFIVDTSNGLEAVELSGLTTFLENEVSAIKTLIPIEATSSNLLADKSWVDLKVETKDSIENFELQEVITTGEPAGYDGYVSPVSVTYQDPKIIYDGTWTNGNISALNSTALVNKIRVRFWGTGFKFNTSIFNDANEISFSENDTVLGFINQRTTTSFEKLDLPLGDHTIELGVRALTEYLFDKSYIQFPNYFDFQGGWQSGGGSIMNVVTPGAKFVMYTANGFDLNYPQSQPISYKVDFEGDTQVYTNVTSLTYKRYGPGGALNITFQSTGPINLTNNSNSFRLENYRPPAQITSTLYSGNWSFFNTQIDSSSISRALVLATDKGNKYASLDTIYNPVTDVSLSGTVLSIKSKLQQNSVDLQSVLDTLPLPGDTIETLELLNVLTTGEPAGYVGIVAPTALVNNDSRLDFFGPWNSDKTNIEYSNIASTTVRFWGTGFKWVSGTSPYGGVLEFIELFETLTPQVLGEINQSNTGFFSVTNLPLGDHTIRVRQKTSAGMNAGAWELYNTQVIEGNQSYALHLKTDKRDQLISLDSFINPLVSVKFSGSTLVFESKLTTNSVDIGTLKLSDRPTIVSEVDSAFGSTITFLPNNRTNKAERYEYRTTSSEGYVAPWISCTSFTIELGNDNYAAGSIEIREKEDTFNARNPSDSVFNTIAFNRVTQANTLAAPRVEGLYVTFLLNNTTDGYTYVRILDADTNATIGDTGYAQGANVYTTTPKFGPLKPGNYKAVANSGAGIGSNEQRFIVQPLPIDKDPDRVLDFSLDTQNRTIHLLTDKFENTLDISLLLPTDSVVPRISETGDTENGAYIIFLPNTRSPLPTAYEYQFTHEGFTSAWIECDSFTIQLGNGNYAVGSIKIRERALSNGKRPVTAAVTNTAAFTQTNFRNTLKPVHVSGNTVEFIFKDTTDGNTYVQIEGVNNGFIYRSGYYNGNTSFVSTGFNNWGLPPGKYLAYTNSGSSVRSNIEYFTIPGTPTEHVDRTADRVEGFYLLDGNLHLDTDKSDFSIPVNFGGGGGSVDNFELQEVVTEGNTSYVLALESAGNSYSVPLDNLDNPLQEAELSGSTLYLTSKRSSTSVDLAALSSLSDATTLEYFQGFTPEDVSNITNPSNWNISNNGEYIGPALTTGHRAIHEEYASSTSPGALYSTNGFGQVNRYLAN